MKASITSILLRWAIPNQVEKRLAQEITTYFARYTQNIYQVKLLRHHW